MDQPQLLFGVPMTIPFDLPESQGFTHLEFREYQSWRIEIQVICMLLLESPVPVYRIKDMATKVNNRSKLFPTRPFPNDLFILNSDKSGMVLCNPHELLNRIRKLTGHQASEADTPTKIYDTTNFSEELERVFVSE